MARSQFTFTFPNAQPGAAVTFSAAVYSSKVDASADGPTLVLDSQRTIAVWTDATELTATWKDGAGAPIAAEASLDRPVVTAIGGTPGEPTAASSVTFNANTHAIGTAASTSTSGSPANNNDGPVVALAVGPVKVAPGGYVVTFTYTTQGPARLVNLNAQVANADVTEAIYFFAGDLPVDLGPSGQITGAQLDFAPTLVGTDLSVDVDGTVHSAAGGVFWIAANFYVRPA